MAKETIQIEVEKEAYALGKLLCDVLVGLKAKKPLMQIAAEELAAIESAVAHIGELGGEIGDGKAAFAKSLMLPLADAVSALLG